MTYFCPDIAYRKIILLLLLLALLPACEKEQIATYPGTQPYNPPAYQTYSSGGAEVVERSMLFIGGPKTVYHEVGPLETVWRIARMYDVPPSPSTRQTD